MLRALVLSIAAVGAGCSGDINNLPTTPDPVFVTETFSGTININGSETIAYLTDNSFTTAGTGTIISILP